MHVCCTVDCSSAESEVEVGEHVGHREVAEGMELVCWKTDRLSVLPIGAGLSIVWVATEGEIGLIVLGVVGNVEICDSSECIIFKELLESSRLLSNEFVTCHFQ